MINILISKLQDKNLKIYFNWQLLEHTHIHQKDGNYYDQIDGVVLGFPFGPVLSNLFMSFHEKRCLDQFRFCDFLLYRRYVDNNICLFNSE